MRSFRITFPPTHVLGLTVAGQAIYWLIDGIPYGNSPLWTGIVAVQAAFGLGAAVWSRGGVLRLPRPLRRVLPARAPVAGHAAHSGTGQVGPGGPRAAG